MKYDETVGMLHGRIINTKDVVSFETASAGEARANSFFIIPAQRHFLGETPRLVLRP